MTIAASISFTEFQFPIAERFWAFRQMGTFGRSMRDVAGLAFWRLLGTAKTFGGATPDFARYVLLSVWDSVDGERRFWREHAALRRYAERSDRAISHRLALLASKGTWDGCLPFGEPTREGAGHPLGVLTRATLRPAAQLAFWRRSTAVEDAIARAAVHAVPFGELPILRSGTFSIWPDARAIARFVEEPTHQEAMRARSRERLYREELFARFAVLGTVEDR